MTEGHLQIINMQHKMGLVDLIIEIQQTSSLSVMSEHVKQLIKTWHRERGPAHVRPVSLPFAELARQSGSHLFSLAPLTTAIREVS